MKLIPLQCPSCGAKLRVPAAATVTCEYCGTESVVQRREGLLERAVPLEEAVDLPVATQRHSGRWALLAIALPLSCPAVGLAAGVYEFTRLDWMGFSQPILADVDGDGDADAVGLVQRGNQDAFVAAFDGKTGEQLWGTDKIGDHAAAVAGSLVVADGTVLFIGGTGALTAFDGKTGETRWKNPGLGEKVRDVCSTEPGTLVVQLADRTHRVLGLSTGSISTDAPGTCKPVWYDKRPFSPDTPTTEAPRATAGNVRGEVAFDTGDGWLLAGYKDRGSRVPMLAMTDPANLDERGELSARWVTAVPASNPLEARGELLVTVSDDTAFAVYELKEGLPHLTAVSLANGIRRWDVEIDRDAPLSGVAYAEGRVYVALWSSLITYDAKTGEELDRIGL
jgi:outer membrane protein assembly factor BamB